MKILFVHEVSWQKKVTYEIHDYPELLQLRGHEVSFIEYDEKSVGKLTKSTRTRIRFWGTESFCTRAHFGSSVRVVTPWRILPSMFGRLLAVFIHPLVILRELVFNRPDVITIYSIPTNGWQTVMLARCFRIPTIFRAIDVPHAIRSTKFNHLIQIAERFVYKNVDHLSTHNHAMVKYLVRQNANANKITVTIPGVDLTHYRPQEPNEQLQRDLNIINTDKVIVFMGTLFKFCGLHEFLSIASPHLSNSDSIKLLIIGDGDDMDRITETTEQLGLKNKVVFAGRVEHEHLPKYLNLGTVAILPFLDIETTQFALPWKISQYMACGLPTFSTRLEGLCSVLDVTDGIIYSESVAELVNQVFVNIDDASSISGYSKTCRKSISLKGNWARLIVSFENDILKVVNGYKK
jgi:glycosyltransferase involved in cell wall biosynthesis